jgi:hypothetical protein
MTRAHSEGETARVARRRDVRRRLPCLATRNTAEERRGPDIVAKTVSGSFRTDPYDEEGMDALRSAWRFLE